MWPAATMPPLQIGLGERSKEMPRRKALKGEGN